MAAPLGYPKTKKNFQLQGASLHWPPDQGLCPKMCQQYHRTVLLPGSVYIYCLIVPHRNCMRKKYRWHHFSLQKWRKIGDFKVDFLKIFLGHSPQTPILGRGYGAPPQTPPPRRSGASRLRASLGTFGPSIVQRSPAPNLPLHHWQWYLEYRLNSYTNHSEIYKKNNTQKQTNVLFNKCIRTHEERRYNHTNWLTDGQPWTIRYDRRV